MLFVSIIGLLLKEETLKYTNRIPLPKYTFTHINYIQKFRESAVCMRHHSKPQDNLT